MHVERMQNYRKATTPPAGSDTVPVCISALGTSALHAHLDNYGGTAVVNYQFSIF